MEGALLPCGPLAGVWTPFPSLHSKEGEQSGRGMCEDSNSQREPNSHQGRSWQQGGRSLKPLLLVVGGINDRPHVNHAPGSNHQRVCITYPLPRGVDCIDKASRMLSVGVGPTGGARKCWF